MSATQIKTLRAWHEELLEYILANPRASLKETAFYFNVSITWLSIVKNSDAFQELWAQRRGEHFSRVSANISERVTALAEVTVDALTNKVEKEVAEGSASIATLREVSEMALKSLGFGARSPNGGIPSVTINNQPVIIDKETLAAAREAKAQLAATMPKPQIIEHVRKEGDYET